MSGKNRHLTHLLDEEDVPLRIAYAYGALDAAVEIFLIDASRESLERTHRQLREALAAAKTKADSAVTS